MQLKSTRARLSTTTHSRVGIPSTLCERTVGISSQYIPTGRGRRSIRPRHKFVPRSVRRNRVLVTSPRFFSDWDFLLTVDHGDFNLLSDVTLWCTVAACTQTSTLMHLFISHFLSSAGLTFYNCLTASHPHLMVFVAVACCLGHAKILID